ALAKARRRLAFEELFLLQIGLLRLKEGTKQQAGEPILLDIKDEYVKLLPFTLTRAQQRALDEGLSDMRGAHPMNRLLQGDVGSGKTAVAAGLLYTAVRGGRQAAFMAPTEILAMQHAESLKWLPVRAGLLLGSTPPAAKKRLREALAAGEIDLVIGTHALLSEGVEYKDLGLVVTDEQHRFGVRQRAALADKGDNPHRLVMSATPIPRSLALIVYGDLDISVLDELPPGRTPVETYAVGSDKRQRAYNYIKKHLDGGRQGFLVCPLIEDTGGGELLSAQALFKDLQQGAFKGYRLGLLHGRMKAADKDAVMAAFAAGEVQLLISTTVIEVGIDVPNAVIMVIENADRFGLAQLHQLRGRVGRGAAASTCILISDAQGEEAKQRLRILCTTNDGFRIAEEDLRLRGPGDFFGNRQHGLPLLKIADLVSDMPLLRDAQQAARKLLDADFELNGFPALRGEMEKMFQRAAV
ncbi:MAG: ATP-dependent DNA helicase RecG, partial [Oscillospiraceae bacterium]|nr:ATP-dependent DNA helicase RecG [Oscillospiraceae bacterium]